MCGKGSVCGRVCMAGGMRGAGEGACVAEQSCCVFYIQIPT